MKKLFIRLSQFVNERKSNLSFWLYFLGISAILICFLPLILTQKSFFGIDFSKTGEIGDTISGIMSPFVGLLGAFLTFIAFWIQFRANQKQFGQFDKQDEKEELGRFENKFFELLKIHRDNVQEMVIHRPENENIKGRRVFIEMFKEFRFVFFLTKHRALSFDSTNPITKLTDEQLVEVAYLLFFFGVGEDSDNQLAKMFPRKYFELINDCSDVLKKFQDQFPSSYSFAETKKQYKTGEGSIINDSHYYKMIYKPFAGHQSRLGHYFRNLFQIVKFVTSSDDKIVKNKYFYLKTLRAQLSNHEQLFLYYNSISVLGKPWITEGYLSEFRMIKNLPLPMADFGISPKDKLGEYNSEGKKLFEWDEIKERFDS